MKNSWLIWVFIVGVIATVFVAFNYEGGQKAVPLAEIFPEEETYPVDIEYEFVEESAETEAVQKVAASAPKPAEALEKADTEAAKAIETIERKVAAQAQPQTTATQQAAASAEPAADKQQLQELKADTPFTIQVASFKKQSMADGLKQELEKKNMSAYVASRNLGSKGTWYRVYVGQYTSKSDAETALSDIKKSYANSFVISPK